MSTPVSLPNLLPTAPPRQDTPSSDATDDNSSPAPLTPTAPPFVPQQSNSPPPPNTVPEPPQGYPPLGVAMTPTWPDGSAMPLPPQPFPTFPPPPWAEAQPLPPPVCLPPGQSMPPFPPMGLTSTFPAMGPASALEFIPGPPVPVVPPPTQGFPRPHPYVQNAVLYLSQVPRAIKVSDIAEVLTRQGICPTAINLFVPRPPAERLWPDAYYEWMPLNGTLEFGSVMDAEKGLAILSSHPYLVGHLNVLVSPHPPPNSYPLPPAPSAPRFIRPMRWTQPMDTHAMICGGQVWDAIRPWGSIRTVTLFIETEHEGKGEIRWRATVEFWYEDEALMFENNFARTTTIMGWEVDVRRDPSYIAMGPLPFPQHPPLPFPPFGASGMDMGPSFMSPPMALPPMSAFPSPPPPIEQGVPSPTDVHPAPLALPAAPPAGMYSAPQQPSMSPPMPHPPSMSPPMPHPMLPMPHGFPTHGFPFSPQGVPPMLPNYPDNMSQMPPPPFMYHGNVPMMTSMGMPPLSPASPAPPLPPPDSSSPRGASYPLGDNLNGFAGVPHPGPFAPGSGQPLPPPTATNVAAVPPLSPPPANATFVAPWAAHSKAAYLPLSPPYMPHEPLPQQQTGFKRGGFKDTNNGPRRGGRKSKANWRLIPGGIVSEDGTVIQHEPGRHIYPAPIHGPGSFSSSGLVDYCNLIVKHLDADITGPYLGHLFGMYGRVANSRVMRDPMGRSRGFGFVSFLTPQEAGAAIKCMNGKRLGSNILHVSYHEPRCPPDFLALPHKPPKQRKQPRHTRMPIPSQMFKVTLDTTPEVTPTPEATPVQTPKDMPDDSQANNDASGDNSMKKPEPEIKTMNNVVKAEVQEVPVPLAKAEAAHPTAHATRDVAVGSPLERPIPTPRHHQPEPTLASLASMRPKAALEAILNGSTAFRGRLSSLRRMGDPMHVRPGKVDLTRHVTRLVDPSAVGGSRSQTMQRVREFVNGLDADDERALVRLLMYPAVVNAMVLHGQ